MSNHYDRNDGTMIYECDNDGCNEQSTFYGSFSEAVVEAKQEGWRAYKVDEDWHHECPLCVHKGKNTDPREIFG